MKKLIVFVTCLIFISSHSVAHIIGRTGTPGSGNVGGGEAGGCSGYYGEDDTGSATNDSITDDVRFYKFTLSCSGTATHIRGYVKYATGEADEVMFGIYDDDSGPNNLLRQTEVGFCADCNPDWLELALTSSLELSAGDYWLAIYNEAAAYSYHTGVDVGDYSYEYRANVSSWPNLPNPAGSTTGASKRNYLIQVKF